MLRVFEERPSADELVDVMEEDGAAVIHGMAELGLLDQIESEVREHLEADRPGFKSEFNGQDTLRAACILARSRSAEESVLTTSAGCGKKKTCT